MDKDEEFLHELTLLSRKYGLVLYAVGGDMNSGYIQLDKLQPYQHTGSYQIQHDASICWIVPSSQPSKGAG